MQKEKCPYIVFHVDSRLFTVNSYNVTAIMELPEIQPIPETIKGLRGIFMYMGEAVPLLDLRTALGESTLEEEYENFVKMLDTRKEDHRKWYYELVKCADEHKEFDLTTDPHKCAFGKWYYSFKSDNNAVAHHMKKIEEPHRLLHESGNTVNNYIKKGGHDECIHTLLEEVKEKYGKTVLSLIDQAKVVLQDSYREMTLVLECNGRHFGVAVDEVLSVEEVSDEGSSESLAAVANSALISSIKACPRYEGKMILELNENSLLQFYSLAQ